MGLRMLNNQNGAALLTSLMLMSLLTIVGISALNTTDIELKIAGNEKSAAQALYAAEAGVHHCLSFLKANSSGWVDLADENSDLTDTFNDDVASGVIGEDGSKEYSIELDLTNITADSVRFTSVGSAARSTKSITVTFVKQTTILKPEAALSILDEGGSSVAEFSNGN